MYFLKADYSKMNCTCTSFLEIRISHIDAITWHEPSVSVSLLAQAWSLCHIGIATSALSYNHSGYWDTQAIYAMLANIFWFTHRTNSLLTCKIPQVDTFGSIFCGKLNFGIKQSYTKVTVSHVKIQIQARLIWRHFSYVACLFGSYKNYFFLSL